MTWIVVISLIIPLLGTALGSAMVFFLKDSINPKLQKILLGFASGVMIAASIWSLLEPAIDTYDNYKRWLIPGIGFLVGILFLLLLDYLIPHIHIDRQEEGIKKTKLSKTTKMFFAVTLHNIPEGLAVGVVIAGMISGNINEHAMLALSIGIAIQNFPEGAIISMPLREEGLSRFKAFLYGFMSGVVEPIAGLVAILLTYYVNTNGEGIPTVKSFMLVGFNDSKKTITYMYYYNFDLDCISDKGSRKDATYELKLQEMHSFLKTYFYWY